MDSGEFRCWYSVANRDQVTGVMTLETCVKPRHPDKPNAHALVVLNETEKAQWYAALAAYRQQKEAALSVRTVEDAQPDPLYLARQVRAKQLEEKRRRALMSIPQSVLEAAQGATRPTQPSAPPTKKPRTEKQQAADRRRKRLEILKGATRS